MLLFLCIACQLRAQEKPAKPLSFCGWKYKDTAIMKRLFREQLDFLHVNDNDTIVDIGASGGAFEGSISVIGKFKDVNFVLVDIDSNCLNAARLDNMINYYSGVKGAPIGQHFQIVINTPDSLRLPANQFKKVWLFNTLHEIPDKQKIVNDIAAVLQNGGELVLVELFSMPKHTVHGGCKYPLLTSEEIDTLFSKSGFTKKEMILNPGSMDKTPRNPFAMIRFIKK